jgi:hypothetical protein
MVDSQAIANRRKAFYDASGSPAPVADTTEPQMPDWLTEIYNYIGGPGGYTLTPDDLQAIAYWSELQQFQLGQGQTDLQNRQNDLGFAQVGLSEDQIKQAEQELGLSRAQLEEKWAEFNFQKDQAPLQHQVDMMNLQNQLTLGGYDVDKAKAYAQAQDYQTQQAQMGVDMAKYNWMANTGQIRPFVSVLDKQKQYGFQG